MAGAKSLRPFKLNLKPKVARQWLNIPGLRRPLMKKHMIRFFAFFGFLFVLAATPTFAQSGPAVTAEIIQNAETANAARTTSGHLARAAASGSPRKGRTGTRKRGPGDPPPKGR